MALVTNARTALKWFLGGCGIVIVPIFIAIVLGDDAVVELFAFFLTLYVVCSCALAFVIESGHASQVAIRALSLGLVFGTGLNITLWLSMSWTIFGWYFCLLSFFHFSEYFTTALTNPRTLSLDSFLINHGREYTIAAVGSWFEFLLERFLVPEMKEVHWISLIGVLMCIGGETVRKLSMITARTNFNHIIQVQREEGHVLVTHGIYSVWRHPSYVGWFWWSIGTQIVLCNPVCIIGYTVASWKFFKDRIIDEEITLLNFFGEDYVMYQKKVPTGLPLIEGFKVEL